MKKLTVCFFLLLLTLVSFGQSTAVKPDLSYDRYMKKSVRQNKLGWILLGGGIALSVITILVASQIKEGGEATAVFVYLGTGLVIITTPVSIPFFFSAHHNKKKAMNLSIKNETAFVPYKLSFPAGVPSVSLKINL